MGHVFVMFGVTMRKNLHKMAVIFKEEIKNVSFYFKKLGHLALIKLPANKN